MRVKNTLIICFLLRFDLIFEVILIDRSNFFFFVVPDLKSRNRFVFFFSIYTTNKYYCCCVLKVYVTYIIAMIE